MRYKHRNPVTVKAWEEVLEYGFAGSGRTQAIMGDCGLERLL